MEGKTKERERNNQENSSLLIVENIVFNFVLSMSHMKWYDMRWDAINCLKQISPFQKLPVYVFLTNGVARYNKI